LSGKPLTDPKIYKKAYLEIKSNTGSMTAGIDLETLDGFSNEKIENIVEQMKN